MEPRTEARAYLRSAGALLAGFVVVAVSHTAMDVLMHATGVFPPVGQPMADGLFALALGYRTVLSAAGSYLTARLAPNRPMGHALVGGAIGLALSVAGAVATWNRGPEFGPHWYPVALAALALPAAWAGGRLYRGKAASTEAG